MIVKIKSHKKPSFRKLLDYMLNDKDRLFDKSGNSFVVTHNLKGVYIEEWENQFKEIEMRRQRKRSDSVYLTHEILSWHRDDAKNISLEKMEVMAREYIRQRNPKGMFVAVPHFDKEHYHIHICASGIEYKTGKALRLSKQEFQKLKKDIQQFQLEKFPELSKSVVVHGKKDKSFITEKEYQFKLRTGRETEKENVLAILKTCYKKAMSKESFFALLQECKLQTYSRGGIITGVVFGKLKFRFKRLGFTEKRLEELDKTKTREEMLSKSRGNVSVERNFQRER